MLCCTGPTATALGTEDIADDILCFRFFFYFAGAVYVYKKIINVWTHQSTIYAHDYQAHDQFGSAVAIDNSNLAYIGAHREDTGGPDSGTCC
jgi:hypothetical protein